MNPLKEERRLCGATLKTAEVLRTYYILLPLQVRRGRAGKNGEVKKRSRDPFHQQGGFAAALPVLCRSITQTSADTTVAR